MFSTIDEYKLQLLEVNDNNFKDLAIAAYNWQLENCEIYHQYVSTLGKAQNKVTHLSEIPFLPISFFTSHKVINNNLQEQFVFESSGTTGSIKSKHFVADLDIYNQTLFQGARIAFGNIEDYVVIALLPGYLERKNSSLVYMVQQWMNQSNKMENGFYLNDFLSLKNTLSQLELQQRKVILIGASFGILDFVEQYQLNLSKTIVIETGGMKGRQKEIVRADLHKIISKGLGVDQVYSEYGMTELLSQAYTKGGNMFFPSPTMKVLAREVNDPLTINSYGKGALNVIDLANINSCCFIATDDLCNIHPNGSFEILGRLDYSALRGCSLLVA